MLAVVGDGHSLDAPAVQASLEASQELLPNVVAAPDAQAIARRGGQREVVPGPQVAAGKALVGPLMVGDVERHPQRRGGSQSVVCSVERLGCAGTRLVEMEVDAALLEVAGGWATVMRYCTLVVGQCDRIAGHGRVGQAMEVDDFQVWDIVGHDADAADGRHDGIGKKDPAQGLLVGLPFPNPIVGELAVASGAKADILSGRLPAQVVGEGYEDGHPRRRQQPPRVLLVKLNLPRGDFVQQGALDRAGIAQHRHEEHHRPRTRPQPPGRPGIPPGPGRNPRPEARDALGGRQRQQRPVEVQGAIFEVVATNPQQIVQMGGDAEQHQRVRPVSIPAPAHAQGHERQR